MKKAIFLLFVLLFISCSIKTELQVKSKPIEETKKEKVSIVDFEKNKDIVSILEEISYFDNFSQFYLFKSKKNRW